MADAVKLTFLGGLGEIGRNCACIEVDGSIILLDCGLMFPDLEMLGIDLVLPDFSYLHDNADRIAGCIVTHGHDDHVGGLAFLLRELSFPIYGSALTLGLASNRIGEAGLLDRTELIAVKDGERRRIGPIDVEFIPVTHSVPHGFATAFHTPQGVILHSGDWKLDLTPVDGRLTDLGRIGAIAHEHGVRLLLSDSTNAEEHGYSQSESAVGQVLYDLFHEHEGQPHHHDLFRLAHPSRATDRRCGHRVRSHDRDHGPLDAQERAPRARDGPAAHTGRQDCVTSKTSTISTRRRCASSARGHKVNRCRPSPCSHRARTDGCRSDGATSSS